MVSSHRHHHFSAQGQGKKQNVPSAGKTINYFAKLEPTIHSSLYRIYLCVAMASTKDPLSAHVVHISPFLPEAAGLANNATSQYGLKPSEQVPSHHQSHPCGPSPLVLWCQHLIYIHRRQKELTAESLSILIIKLSEKSYIEKVYKRKYPTVSCY